MPGRTWPIAPDRNSLERRWAKLIGEADVNERKRLFHPHQSGGPTLDKGAKPLSRQHESLPGINVALKNIMSADSQEANVAKSALELRAPVPYSVRSFDRQWIIPDNRLLNRENAGLWTSFGPGQVYLTALSQMSPENGPAITMTAAIPDHDHYCGRGGRVFPLEGAAGASETNISAAALAVFAKTYGHSPADEDVFAYVAALLANPAYTEKFKSDLVRPGLRVPLTADKKLFAKAAEIGREVIWLHTFGDRFNDGRDPGVPKLPKAERPSIPADGAIPSTPEGFPDAIDHDAAKRRLKIGTGYIDNVAPEVWAYEVSGKAVLKQWFSYRRKNREKPQIGDRRPPSPLGEIQPDHWLPEYTTELLNVINVLGLLVKLEPAQKALLDEIVDGPLIPAGKIG